MVTLAFAEILTERYLKNGNSVVQWTKDVMVGKSIVEAISFLSPIAIMAFVVEVIFSVALCALFAITLFLVTKWLRDPYKKISEVKK